MVQSIEITGKNTIEGGTYNEINIKGMIKILKDVKANVVNISGKGFAHGEFNAKEMILSGKFNADKLVEIDDISCSGKIEVEEDLRFQNFDISGFVTILGNLVGGDLNITGKLSVDKECEVENFYTSGVVKILGLLNADDIEIKVYDHSYIKEIGGNTISIGNPKSPLNLFRSGKFLESNLIEGDKIDINYVKAKVVRGGDIVIKDNVVVDKVEYSGELTVSPKAKIGETIKI
ncbi:hypothetical protein [Mammaliicoccus sciuri]|uniref:Cell shape determination protein CcmA n=1 Tax=Mammaliicoccus sciuri TaxID=1296 RepID=E0D4X0_MAMSC|nr:hypothetical protein [Mammaliicoccus sciuri]PNY93698.1 hypothetical protein CD035_09555 [Mammaliicoccus sciuri]WRY63448.1 hypothetical protein P8F79_00980 [Mammaliicoccus sciuri]BAJ15054.1 conserved hypothetical protein [Mammaliicoccus sciuri]SQE47982.1 Uncharacterised protein [Mammaliicoccus sciuri]